MPADAHHGLDRRWPRRGGAKEASQNAASSVARPAQSRATAPHPHPRPTPLCTEVLSTSEREREEGSREEPTAGSLKVLSGSSLSRSLAPGDPL